MEIGDIELIPLSGNKAVTPEQAGGYTDPKLENGEEIITRKNPFEDSDDDSGEDNFLIPITEEIQKDFSNTNSQSTQTSGTETGGGDNSLKEVLSTLKKVLDEEAGLMNDIPEEEIGDPKTFITKLLEKVEDRAENMVNNYIEQNLNPTQKLFNELVEGGVTVESAASISKLHKEINGLDSDAILTAEDDSVAERVAKTYYKLKTDMSDEEIDSEIKLKVQAGNIRDFASKNLSKVSSQLNDIIEQETNKANSIETSRQQNIQKANQALQDFMSTKAIGEIKVTKEVKDKWLKEFQKNNEGVTPLDRTVKNDPVKFNALLRLYHSMGLFNYDTKSNEFTPDFALIKSLAGKDANKLFESAVEKANLKDASRSTNNTDTNIDKSHFDKLAALSEFL
jgi:hypothetical protein